MTLISRLKYYLGTKKILIYINNREIEHLKEI